MRKVLIGIVAVMAVLAIFISTRPSESHYERSTVINAPPEVVFAHVNDFHKWPIWSPWEGIDMDMKKSFSGAESGKGAIYAWNGNNEVGSGRMTIEDSTPSSDVDIKLEFLTPFEATNQTHFKLIPEGETTKVVWTMDGKNNFMMKGVGLFMNMDKQIGDDFEKGLRAMKGSSEAEVKKIQAEAAAAKAKADEEAAAAAAALAAAEAQAAAAAPAGKKKPK